MMHKSPLYLLLADDDPDDCDFFRDALEDLQISSKLITVKDGVELMHKLNYDSRVPDVLFLDLNMPRKNGFDCLTEIKSNTNLQQLPIIIFSTSFDTDVVKLVQKHGATFYIRKPAEFYNLKKVIQRSLALVSENNSGSVSENFIITP